MPRNVPFGASVYEDSSEVAILREGNLSFWDDNSSWQPRIFGTGGAGAQDELIL
jgi:hypothetical protein